tara:strand:+ start:5418 stop:5780 length:363 start_codon:yes stop_codon:yes gene_type:complete
METKIVKPSSNVIAAVKAAAPVKKPVKQKKVKQFTLNNYTKIDKWDRALPPQAKDIATKLHSYGIEYGKPYTREKISDAMKFLAAAITESSGKKWTRQEPYRIFAYYVKPLRENGVLTIS